MSHDFMRQVRKNKSSRRFAQVIFWDIETLQKMLRGGKTMQVYRMSSACYVDYGNESENGEREILGFYDPVNLVDWILSKVQPKRTLYITSYHLEIDFLPSRLYGLFEAHGFRCEQIIQNDKVVILRFQNGKQKIIVFNLGNIFSGTVENMGKMLNLPKLTALADSNRKEDVMAYCKRDTEIIMRMYEMWVSFLDEHNLGDECLTVGSQAMHAYRHRFMDYPIAKRKTDELVAFERTGYKGARFEALQIGDFQDDTFYQLDENSMYAGIMLREEFPYETRGHKTGCTLRELEKRLKKYAVMARCKVNIPNNRFGHRRDKRLYFEPFSDWETFTTPELIALVENGWIEEVGEITWYYKKPLFQAYARYFIALKDRYTLEDNQVFRSMTKLFLNSLYGKFGEYGHEDEIIGECDPGEFKVISCLHAETLDRWMEYHYGGKIHQVRDVGESANTFVPIAAHIIAYGREEIWRVMETAGLENVYHVATDSVIVNQAGRGRLVEMIDPVQAGMLKEELSGTTLIVKDVNDHVLGGKVKIKGIPRKAVSIDPDTYEVTVWPRMLTILKENKGEMYYTRTVQKHLARTRYREYCERRRAGGL